MRARDRLQAPRGTFDVLPADAQARDEVTEAAAKVLGRAGYARIDTPIFEATELFARGVGESTDVVQKEMFTFEDAGGRSLTLRPEATAAICRSYVQHGMHKLPQPVKVWCAGPFFRHEAPQAGRFRQFTQVDAEAIGSDDPGVDAELIVLLAELLEALDVRDVRLRIGSLGRPEMREAYREQLVAHLRAHEEALPEEVRERIELNPLRAFDSSHPGTVEVMASAPRLLDALDDEDRAHFAEVCADLDALDIAYEVDTTLVRGLDYYARTVFEFESGALGAQSALGGGGRYDGLIELIGGPPTPGCGWAAGIERVLLARPERTDTRELLDLYVAYATPEARARAMRLAAEARRAGLAAQAELAGRSTKGQLKQADRLGARYVAILGDGPAALKDMGSGEQDEIDAAAIPAAILRGGQYAL